MFLSTRGDMASCHCGQIHASSATRVLALFLHDTEDKADISTAGLTAEISPEVMTICSASRSDGDMSLSNVWLRKSKKTCFCEPAVICDGFNMSSSVHVKVSASGSALNSMNEQRCRANVRFLNLCVSLK